MVKFDATEHVDEMEFDLTKYAGPGASGIIPEPTSKQLGGFFAALAQMMRDQIDGDVNLDADDPSQLLAAMDALNEAQFTKMSKAMCEAHARLCSNTPSAAMLNKCPFRVQQAFFGWLQGQFAPNRPAPATTGSLAGSSNETSTTSSAATSVTA